MEALVSAPLLLVVDEETARRQTVSVLRHYHFPSLPLFSTIYEASNGPAAVQLLGKHAISLLITDIRAPVEDGLSLLLRIRRAYPRLKIIAMSGVKAPGGGSALEPLVCLQMARRLGAHRTLLKPLRPGELIEAVENLLAGGD